MTKHTDHRQQSAKCKGWEGKYIIINLVTQLYMETYEICRILIISKRGEIQHLSSCLGSVSKGNKNDSQKDWWWTHAIYLIRQFLLQWYFHAVIKREAWDGSSRGPSTEMICFLLKHKNGLYWGVFICRSTKHGKISLPEGLATSCQH